MRKFSITHAKTANVEVSPTSVALNVTNIRPYKRTEMKTFSDVIKKSVHAFDLQMVKNCEVRLMCIEHFASQKFDNMNLFWTLYMQRADELLDSRRFVLEAKTLSVDPVVLATNIVAHGAGLVAKVASLGIKGSQIEVEDYLCQIVPDSIIKRFMENPEEFFAEKEATSTPEEEAQAEEAEAQPAA